MISLRKIDEDNYGNMNIVYYDGIDIEYASNYKGDDFLIFFVSNWNDVYRINKRDCIINNILSDVNNNCDMGNIESNMIAIYQTSGYLMEVYISVKNKIKREQCGTWNAVVGILGKK